MKITTVSVGLRRTESLPGYSNVSPSINFTAEVEENEIWSEVEAQLSELCQDYVENKIDQALETVGQPAKFYAGPRYTLLHWRTLNLLVIAPDEEAAKVDTFPGTWGTYGAHFYGDDIPCYGGHRLETLRKLAADLEKANRPIVEPQDFIFDWAWAYIDDKWAALEIDVELGDYMRFVSEIVVPCRLWRELSARDDIILNVARNSPIDSREELELWKARRSYDDKTPILETVEQLDEWLAKATEEME